MTSHPAEAATRENGALRGEIANLIEDAICKRSRDWLPSLKWCDALAGRIVAALSRAPQPDTDGVVEWGGTCIGKSDPYPLNPKAQPDTVTGWQPIETAPRDETRFIFRNRSGYVGIGRFIHKTAFAADSWGGLQDTIATHWIPLPEAK